MPCAKLGFDKLRKANVKRFVHDFSPLLTWTMTDWACALAGEAGETCNAVKKLKRGDGGKEAVAMELADTIIYADLLAANLGIDLGAAVIKKFNIVSKRKYSNITLSADKE